MKNIFDPSVTKEVIGRINTLQPGSKPLWGKMNVAQMLAHCNKIYELVYDNVHPKPNAIVKFLTKTFAKEAVVGEKPYKRNGMTAPIFVVKEEKDFEKEKQRLIVYINRTQLLGGTHFHNKESHSFGRLSTGEWNNMFYKHLDHHLTQFGV